MHATRIKNSKPIGKLLGDAVMSAIQTLLMIGGFIILFSVFNKLLLYMHVTSVFGMLVSQLLHLAHFSEKLSIPLISGLFEVTLGIQMISEVQESSLLQQVIAASFILGFGGFSIQAQVASILAQTDIRFRPFFLARLLHGFLSAVIIRLVWNPVYLRFFAEKARGRKLLVCQVEAAACTRASRIGLEFTGRYLPCPVLCCTFSFITDPAGQTGPEKAQKSGSIPAFSDAFANFSINKLGLFLKFLVRCINGMSGFGEPV